MNSEIPSIWLIVSGLFFLLGIVVFIASLVVLMKILKLAEELKPKVESLSSKVETLMVKIDRVSDRVEEVAVSAKSSIDDFRGSSNGIMGTVEHLAKSVATKSDMITPILTGGLAAYKVFMTIRAARQKPKALKRGSR
ncbi:MAG: hypothetical protein P4L46_13760 [Fimbriimonas sp.]|nr:hypothetical protein [Fimbriimonas sp.]